MAVVTVIGEVVLDRFVSDESTVDVAGGSSANTALAMHVAGHDVRMRARYSLDEAGRFLKSFASEVGLNVEDSIDAVEPATMVEIALSSQGVPTYDFRIDGTADWQWSDAELAIPLPNDTSAIVTGSLASVFAPGSDALLEWTQHQRNNGVILAYDPNARPSAIAPEMSAEVRARIIHWVASSDVVKVSDEDLEWIVPNSDPHEVAAEWSSRGASLVVLTGGANGAWAYRSGELVTHVDAPKIDVIDTVGAGDTLMAWLVTGLLDTSENSRFDDGSIHKVLSRAVRAAAITCTRRGCQPPTLNDLD